MTRYPSRRVASDFPSTKNAETLRDAAAIMDRPFPASEILRQNPQLRIVGEASDGLEAVQKAIELMPDLILLDIGLPGIDGLEASKRIHAVVPGVKIIFVSMNGSAVIMRAALSNRATGYVLKADAGSELLTAIEAAFQGRTFVSSGLAGRIVAAD